MECSKVGPSFIADVRNDLSKFPDTVALKILHYLDIDDLCRLACVSRRWKVLISRDSVWISIGSRVGYIGTQIKFKVLIHCKTFTLRQKEKKAILALPGNRTITVIKRELTSLKEHQKKRLYKTGPIGYPIDRGLDVHTGIRSRGLNQELEVAHEKIKARQELLLLSIVFCRVISRS